MNNSHYSETVYDIIEERDLTAADFQMSELDFNDLINGRIIKTHNLCVLLSEVCGSTVGFWTRR